MATTSKASHIFLLHSLAPTVQIVEVIRPMLFGQPCASPCRKHRRNPVAAGEARFIKV